MSEPFIILTSPHSYCKKTSYDPYDPQTYKYRMCDNEALKAIESLGKKIPYHHALIESDVIRSTRDLNRPWGENDPFWTGEEGLFHKIDDVIQEHDDPIFLLDIHSFPEMDDISHLPLFIIDRTYAHNGTGKPSSYVTHLRDYLINNGIRTEIKPGTDENAIIEYGLGKGLKSLLIEFNERLTDEDLDHLTTLIVQWLHKEINFPSHYFIRQTERTEDGEPQLPYNYVVNRLMRKENIKPQPSYYFY